jgi:hypothetical protein
MTARQNLLLCKKCKRLLPREKFAFYRTARNPHCYDCRAGAERKRLNPPPPPNPSGLCMCGCGQTTARSPVTDFVHGRVAGQHQRFVRGHNLRGEGPSYLVNAETGCWEWQRYKDKSGFGRISTTGGYSPLAHRQFFQRLRGPIPAGLTLKHKCHNHGCVNPDHLELTPLAPHQR